MFLQITPMDVTLFYGSEDKQSAIIKKYSQELESRGVLLLIAKAIDMYNRLVLPKDKIDLNGNPDLVRQSSMSEILYNLRSLSLLNNEAEITNPNIYVRDMKRFLIKMYWMGYAEHTQYLNWKYVRNSLRFIDMT